MRGLAGWGEGGWLAGVRGVTTKQIILTFGDLLYIGGCGEDLLSEIEPGAKVLGGKVSQEAQ